MADTKPPKVRYTDTVCDWLNANPGFHAPREVAAETGVSSTKAANTLSYLARLGRIKRKRDLHLRNGPGASSYSI